MGPFVLAPLEEYFFYFYPHFLISFKKSFYVRSYVWVMKPNKAV